MCDDRRNSERQSTAQYEGVLRARIYIRSSRDYNQGGFPTLAHLPLKTGGILLCTEKLIEFLPPGPSRSLFAARPSLLSPTAAARLLRDAVVDAVAGLGPLGAGALVHLAAVVPVAVEVLVAVGKPAVSKNIVLVKYCKSSAPCMSAIK